MVVFAAFWLAFMPLWEDWGQAGKPSCTRFREGQRWEQDEMQNTITQWCDYRLSLDDESGCS